MKKNAMMGRVTVVAAFLVASATAQDVTWDGNGVPDDDGNWSFAQNWSSDAVPGTTDRAILPSVANGLRTVTQDTTAGTTVSALRLAQSGTSGTNKLSLGGNLTLSKTSREAATEDSTTSAFQVERSDGATAENVQVDLNGMSIRFTGSGGDTTSGGNLAGTVNFNATGSAIYCTPVSTAIFNVFGPLNVTANGMLGRNNGTSSSKQNCTVNMRIGSALNLDSGEFRIEAAGYHGASNNTLFFNNSGTVGIADGASLAQQFTSSSSSVANYGSIALVNTADGTITQSGTLSLRPYRGTTAAGIPTMTVTNNGTWIVSGANAVVKRRTTQVITSTIAMPTFTVGATTGTLRGNSADDTLEFNEEVADGTRRMTVTNNGLAAPGAGSQGAGTTSVGTLRLKDIDLTMGSTGKVVLDLGGSDAGQYDQLLLQAGATDPAGSGAFDLSAGGTLQLYTVNGFTPAESFSVTLISAGSVTGQFSTVRLDGDTFVDNVLVLPGGILFSVDYTADAVQLNCVGRRGTLVLLR